MDLAKIRGVVAERHGFVLTEGDPVLATVTMHEMVLGEIVAQMERSARQVGAELAIGGNESLAGAKAAAVQLVNEGGAWIVERFKEAADRAAVEVAEKVAASLAGAQAAAGAAVAARQIAVWAAIGSVALSCSILAAAIGFWLGGR